RTASVNGLFIIVIEQNREIMRNEKKIFLLSDQKTNNFVTGAKTQRIKRKIKLIDNQNFLSVEDIEVVFVAHHVEVSPFPLTSNFYFFTSRMCQEI
ncbi:hypothetical protein ACJX0J_020879, partial [Zea mays]